MKKIYLIVLIATALIFMGCSSAPVETVEVAETLVENVEPIEIEVIDETIETIAAGKNALLDHEIVDHADAVYGGNIPTWVTTTSKAEQAATFNEAHKVIIVAHHGTIDETLETLENNAKNYDKKEAFATELSNALNILPANEKNAVAKELKAAVNDASITGLEDTAEYWVKYKDTEGQEFYDYLMAYTLTKGKWEENLANVSNALSEETKAILMPVLNNY